jgi:hypothetical protein
MVLRIESITNTGEGLEIVYAEEADIDYKSGVIEARIARIPHEAIPHELIAELVDNVVQILDAARIHKHRVADTFTAPR